MPSARQQQVVSVHGGHEAAEWLVLLSQDARLPPQRRPSLPPCRAAFDGKRVNEKVCEGLPCLGARALMRAARMPRLGGMSDVRACMCVCRRGPAATRLPHETARWMSTLSPCSAGRC